MRFYSRGNNPGKNKAVKAAQNERSKRLDRMVAAARTANKDAFLIMVSSKLLKTCLMPFNRRSRSGQNLSFLSKFSIQCVLLTN